MKSKTLLRVCWLSLLMKEKLTQILELSYCTIHDPTIHDPVMKDSCINYVFLSMAYLTDGGATAYIASKSLIISLL